MSSALAMDPPHAEGGCSRHHEELTLNFKEPKKIQLSEQKAGAAQVRNEHQLLQTISKLNSEHKYELNRIQEDIINLRFRQRVIDTEKKKRTLQRFQKENPNRDFTMDMAMIDQSIKYIKEKSVHDCAYKRVCGKKSAGGAGGAVGEVELGAESTDTPEEILCYVLEKRVRERQQKRDERKAIYVCKPPTKPKPNASHVQFKPRNRYGNDSSTEDDLTTEDEYETEDDDGQIEDQTKRRAFTVYQSHSAPHKPRQRGAQLTVQTNQVVGTDNRQNRQQGVMTREQQDERHDAITVPRSKTSLSKLSKTSAAQHLTTHEKLLEESKHLNDKLNNFFNKMDATKAATTEQQKGVLGIDWSANRLGQSNSDYGGSTGSQTSSIKKVIYPMYRQHPKPATPKVKLPTSLQGDSTDSKSATHIRGIPRFSAERAKRYTPAGKLAKMMKIKRKTGHNPKSAFY